MKIGIYTITEGENYGNRLQNYALQKVLIDRKNNVKTLKTSQSRDSLVGEIKLLIKKLLNVRYGAREKQKVSFKKFNNKYIRFENCKINESNKFAKVNTYDCFVAGSDQIWNPNFQITTDSSFLQFAEQKTKIAISASFGVAKIEDKKL